MSASITLTHAGAGSSLELVPDAGMVAVSWMVAGDEVLALPCGREEFLAAARTGGLPVLYPYANRLGADSFEVCGKPIDLAGVPSLKRDDKRHPIHGLLLRRGGWALAVHGPGQLSAELDWGASAELMHAFPFAHTLRIMWTMAAGVTPGAAVLRVDTQVRADKGVDVPAAFGWHPYFAVREPSTATLVRAPMAGIALDPDGLPTKEGLSTGKGQAELRASAAQGDPRAPAAFGTAAPHTERIGQGQDALFMRAGIAGGMTDSASEAGSSSAAAAAPAPVASIIDAHRRIDIRMNGHYPFVQVFSPHGAAFACIEPMVGPTDGLRTGHFATVRAGTSLSATFEVEVTPCPPATGQGSPTRPSSAA
jgi:aldose 1-epimerase